MNNEPQMPPRKERTEEYNKETKLSRAELRRQPPEINYHSGHKSLNKLLSWKAIVIFSLIIVSLFTATKVLQYKAFKKEMSLAIEITTGVSLYLDKQFEYVKLSKYVPENEYRENTPEQAKDVIDLIQGELTEEKAVALVETEKTLKENINSIEDSLATLRLLAEENKDYIKHSSKEEEISKIKESFKERLNKISFIDYIRGSEEKTSLNKVIEEYAATPK